MKVLHIEPDEYYHQKLKDSISSFAEVVSSREGGRTMRLIEQHAPDVVVMELFLQNEYGYKVLEQIKSHRQARSMPVIIFSKINNMEDVEKALAAGVTGFYVKGENSLNEVRELLLRLA